MVSMLPVVQVQVPLVVHAKVAAVRCKTLPMGGSLLACWATAEPTSSMEVFDEISRPHPLMHGYPADTRGAMHNPHVPRGR